MSVDDKITLALAKKVEPVRQLSEQEKQRLNQLEKIVVENFKTFVQVGQALAEINERKLYRTKSKTFERYCKVLFDIGKRRAYELIDAAEVVENVRHGAHFQGEAERFLPNNERQVRPLAKLGPDQQVAIWQAAVESAPNGKVTGSHVKKVVNKFIGEKIKNVIARTHREAVVSCSSEYAAAFKVFSDQICKEREAKYKHTARGYIVRSLDQLRAEMAEDGHDIEDNIITGGSDDWRKLTKAGFSLFRMDRSSMTIRRRSDETGGWLKDSGPYETLKEMEAEFKSVLQDDMHLRG